MKKYILDIFHFDEENWELKNKISELSLEIARFNHEQPEQDFVNYLHNRFPYVFLFYVGGVNDNYIDIQLRDESRRVGTVKIVDEEIPTIEEQFLKLTYEEMKRVHFRITDIKRDKFNDIYKVITFTNLNGNISSKIREKTGFSCTWYGRKDYTGELHVIIPTELYTPEVEHNIRIEFDSFYNSKTKQQEVDEYLRSIGKIK